MRRKQKTLHITELSPERFKEVRKQYQEESGEIVSDEELKELYSDILFFEDAKKQA